MASRIYARKGEKVTCTKGCVILEINYDIFHHDDISSSTTIILTDRPSKSFNPQCPCGGIWWKWTEDRKVKLHFEGGWR